MRGIVLILAFAALLLGIHALRGGQVPSRYLPLGQFKVDSSPRLPVVTDWQVAALRTDADACATAFARSNALVSPKKDRPMHQGCGWQNALSVHELFGASMRPVVLSCPVAASLARWVRNVVQPAATSLLSSRVTKIKHFGSYSCRNIRSTTKLHVDRRSEHATANAIDISGFVLADGSTVSVLNDWNGDSDKARFLRQVHAGACKHFRVVLGPEANRLHRNHFHFDRGWLFSCR